MKKMTRPEEKMLHKIWIASPRWTERSDLPLELILKQSLTGRLFLMFGPWKALKGLCAKEYIKIPDCRVLYSIRDDIDRDGEAPED